MGISIAMIMLIPMRIQLFYRRPIALLIATIAAMATPMITRIGISTITKTVHLATDRLS